MTVIKMMAQLTHLCNQIITEGKWPAEFRGSIYVPIYKKGDTMDCNNYRTISSGYDSLKLPLRQILVSFTC